MELKLRSLRRRRCWPATSGFSEIRHFQINSASVGKTSNLILLLPHNKTTAAGVKCCWDHVTGTTKNCSPWEEIRK